MRLISLVLALTPLVAAAGERPKEGQAAPEFALAASTGGTIKLSDYKGKRTVVLAFFPKSFTGG